jgi:hypothetical protein
VVQGFSGDNAQDVSANETSVAVIEWKTGRRVWSTGGHLRRVPAEPTGQRLAVAAWLAGHAVIERALAYRLEHLANLRNLLAYDREQTDIDDVYSQIQTRIPDLVAFADQVEKFVDTGDLS